ncbi:hypothetical protein LG329_09820 [Virgibacillus necropolis]|uniref:hypothetical protein n=1 Tax=Virgibacillus necropolis TaxID=163877 RepID=UPI0038512F95
MEEKQGIYIPVRFNTMLNRALRNKSTFITAPAGYGKTTLVMHWSQLSIHSFVWLEMMSSFNNPVTLSTHLKRVVDETLNNKVVIVIDHVHLLEQPEAFAELNKSMLQAPPRITFILLSRKALPYLKNSSALQHQTYQLDAEEIKFSREEAEVWLSLRSSYSIELTENQLTDLHTITDCCPALLQIAYQHYVQHDRPIIDDQGRVAPLLEDYLLNEWLGQLPKDTLQQLRPLVIPPYLSFDFAKELMQTETEPLFHILEQHLILTKSLVNNRWLHRFHPLVRAIINERFSLFDNELKVRGKTAIFLEKEGLLKEAIEVAIQGHNPRLALQYIKKIAPETLLFQDYKTLQDWLNRLGPKQFSQDEEILSLYNWVLTMLNLSNDLDPLITDTKKDLWTPFISLNQGSMPFISNHFGFEGDINRVLSEYQVSGYKDEYPAFSPFRHLAIAEASYEQNNISVARLNLEQVWLSIKSNDFPGLSIPALWLDLLCHKSEGRIQKTHYIIQEIYYRSLHTSIPAWRRMGKASRTYVQLQEGLHDEAEEWVFEQKSLMNINWDQWTSFEYFTLTRALLAFQETEEANYLLNRMITSKSFGKNQSVHLKRRILQTITSIKLERHSEAKIFLQEA